jgi:transcriptional regulator with XRE-family HTH domain
METLGTYLDRVMRQKKLTPKELAKRCKVTDSYIGRVLKGKADNLTVKTMMTLAEGLGVNAHEIFTAASGIPADESAQVNPLLLLDHMQRLINDPTGFEVLRQWLQLPSKKQKPMLDFITFLNEQPRKTPGKSRKK